MRIYKSRNNSQLAAAAVMVPLSVWRGWGRGAGRVSEGRLEKEEKKTRLFIYFSLETSAMFGEWQEHVAPVVAAAVVVSPLCNTSALRHSLECRVVLVGNSDV